MSRHIRKGDRGRLLYRIDSGRLRPSRSLADEQKIVYETALAIGAEVHELELPSHFRCNGSDGYLA